MLKKGDVVDLEQLTKCIGCGIVKPIGEMAKVSFQNYPQALCYECSVQPKWQHVYI